MRIISMVIFFVLLCILAATLADAAQQTKVTFDEIIKKAEEAPTINSINKIMNLDVYRYFNIKVPETALQKKLFKENFEDSDEYKNKKKELEAMKNELFSKIYFLILDSDDLSKVGEIGDYDLGKKSIPLFIGRYPCKTGQLTQFEWMAHFHDQPSKTFRDYIFQTLPIQSDSSALNPHLCDDNMYLPVSEEVGLELEKNKSRVKTYLVFKIADFKPVEYFAHSIFSGLVSEMIAFFPFVIDVRVLLVNDMDGTIYFDETYKSPKSAGTNQEQKESSNEKVVPIEKAPPANAALSENSKENPTKNDKTPPIYRCIIIIIFVFFAVILAVLLRFIIAGRGSEKRIDQ